MANQESKLLNAHEKDILKHARGSDDLAVRAILQNPLEEGFQIITDNGLNPARVNVILAVRKDVEGIINGVIELVSDRGNSTHPDYMGEKARGLMQRAERVQYLLGQTAELTEGEILKLREAVEFTKEAVLEIHPLSAGSLPPVPGRPQNPAPAKKPLGEIKLGEQRLTVESYDETKQFGFARTESGHKVYFNIKNGAELHGTPRWGGSKLCYWGCLSNPKPGDKIDGNVTKGPQGYRLEWWTDDLVPQKPTPPVSAAPKITEPRYRVVMTYVTAGSSEGV